MSEDVVFKNSEIIQPCYVEKNVVLKNTKIVLYIFLGADSIVNDAEICNANSNHAMIGNHVKYKGKYTSVSIENYTELI